MDSPVSQLPSIATITSADFIPVVQAGVTSKATAAQIVKPVYDTFSASSGATAIGFGNRTLASKLGDLVSVKDAPYNAKGDGATDDYAAIQSCLDTLYAAGGGVAFIPAGVFLFSQPLRVQKGVSVIGAGKEITTLRKTTAVTKVVAYVGGVFSGPYPGTPPNAMNAGLILDGPSGYYSGTISDFALEGYYVTPGNYETHAVEFGIIGTGHISDSTITRLYVRYCKYPVLIPDIFAAEISNVRALQGIGGIGINQATSLAYFANYATSCRDYGHYFRGVKYSNVTANACDSLNRPDFYPTRSRTCSAYVFSASLGLHVHGNGQETTYGRHWEFRGFDESTFQCNNSANLGSDYVGVDQIAVFYSTDTMRGSTVVNSYCHDYNPSGLIFGGADAAKHHNIYFEGTANVSDVRLSRLTVRASTVGSTVVEAGWLNDVTPANVNAMTDFSSMSSTGLVQIGVVGGHAGALSDNLYMPGYSNTISQYRIIMNQNGAGLWAMGTTTTDDMIFGKASGASGGVSSVLGKLDKNGVWSGVNLVITPAAAVTPVNNGEMTFELTSNTQMKVKVKGSDGVVRSSSLTLA